MDKTPKTLQDALKELNEAFVKLFQEFVEISNIVKFAKYLESKGVPVAIISEILLWLVFLTVLILTIRSIESL